MQKQGKATEGDSKLLNRDREKTKQTKNNNNNGTPQAVSGG